MQCSQAVSKTRSRTSKLDRDRRSRDDPRPPGAVVRGTSRAGEPVTGMSLTADLTRFEEVLAEARTWPGIFAVRGWVNQGSSRWATTSSSWSSPGRSVSTSSRSPAARLPDQDGSRQRIRTRLRRRHDMYACAECGRAACCESPDTASYPRECPSRSRSRPRYSACTGRGRTRIWRAMPASSRRTATAGSRASRRSWTSPVAAATRSWASPSASVFRPRPPSPVACSGRTASRSTRSPARTAAFPRK